MCKRAYKTSCLFSQKRPAFSTDFNALQQPEKLKDFEMVEIQRLNALTNCCNTEHKVNETEQFR